METRFKTSYKGFTIRIRKTGVNEIIFFVPENYVVEIWKYREELDMEELDCYMCEYNMMKALVRARKMIDMVVKNRRKV